MPIKKMAGIVTALLLSSRIPAGQALAFESPISSPAVQTRLGASSALLGTAMAGSRIVAVGLRGLIIYSDDAGASWKQAPAPTQSDLFAVSFPSAKKGWAVGHGGVVLHSADAGATWVRQLDGVKAAALAVSHYQASSAPEAAALLEREKNLQAGGGTQPFLDVYFESESTGFVVGTFNRIFRTEDGGKSWTPWMERTDNPGELHFYSIRGRNGSLYLTGEQGTVWRLDTATQRIVLQRHPVRPGGYQHRRGARLRHARQPVSQRRPGPQLGESLSWHPGRHYRRRGDGRRRCAADHPGRHRDPQPR